MKRKLIALVTTVAMLLTLLPMGAWAETSEMPSAAADSQENASTDSTTTETSEQINIATADELLAFAKDVNEGKYTDKKDVNVTLTADIDMSGKDWTPIGGEAHYFSGTFDGKGHTVSGLVIDKATDGKTLGFFGATNANIQNLNVTGSGTPTHSVDGDTLNTFGPIAGYSEGVIQNCTTDFKITSGDDWGAGWGIGGIVGEVANGTVSNCVSKSDITVHLYGYCGGIVGGATNGTISNCQNQGTIIIENDSVMDAGGIVGFAQTGSTIESCTNSGTISNTTHSPNLNVGGICGELYGDGNVSSIRFCHNAGAILTYAYASGGIVANVNYATGDQAVIEGCLNTGSVHSLYDPAETVTRNYLVAGIVSIGRSKIKISNNVSLGTLDEVKTGAEIHPITTSVEDSGIVENNLYDENLTINGAIADVITSGSQSLSEEESSMEKIVDFLNENGGRYRLNESGEIEVAPLTYTVTVEGSAAETTGAGEYSAGETVSLDAGTKEGYTFAGWTTEDPDVTFANAMSAQTTFVMPSQAVTVTANWKEAVTVNPGPARYAIRVTDAENGHIDASATIAVKGKTVSFTVTPEDGYVVDAVTVTGRDGKAISVSKDGDGYSFTMPSSMVTISAIFAKGEEPAPEPEPEALPFTDVSAGVWYYDPVQFVFAEGLMTGTSATTFSPNLTTTRGMIVAILYRMEGEPDISSENLGYPFADVDANAYYGDAVYWARLHGIVNGYSSESFGPNDTITREQLAAILYNYASYKGADVSKRADLSAYTDAASVSGWASDAMQWANAEGIVNGTSATTLAPKDSATRAQVAAMLERYVENIISD